MKAKILNARFVWKLNLLYPNESNNVLMNDGTSFKATEYCELIHLEGSKALAYYQEDFYQGMPAFTVNDYGKGKAYYIAFRSDANCTDKIVSMLLNDAEISSSFDGKLPYGVTAHSRSDEEKKFVFIQNFTHNIQTLKTQKKWCDFETNDVYYEEIMLKPFETKILTEI